eukprot:4080001-Ditylum_brightwellii.AAC.1
MTENNPDDYDEIHSDQAKNPSMYEIEFAYHFEFLSDLHLEMGKVLSLKGNKKGWGGWPDVEFIIPDKPQKEYDRETN